MTNKISAPYLYRSLTSKQRQKFSKSLRLEQSSLYERVVKVQIKKWQVAYSVKDGIWLSYELYNTINMEVKTMDLNYLLLQNKIIKT